MKSMQQHTNKTETQPLPPRDGKKQELRDQESNIKRQETWPRLRDGRLCPQVRPYPLDLCSSCLIAF